MVGKGWLTGLIEAGEGVSLSFQLRRQPREKTVSAISQATMVNRSRMRDVGDTRQDFEELGDAIYAGTYLKEGMNREGEDFYYMHVLIEVVADDPETLERRVNAVETLCVASDMLAKRLREQGRKIVCIVPEKGHEYRPLCEAVGGQFIKLGLSSPDCVGLMEIRRLHGRTDQCGHG